MFRAVAPLPKEPRPKEKLYCYVDETGQDAASTVFVVVAVVSAEEQDALRQALMEIERCKRPRAG
jgi:hypothetical protein